MCSCKGAKGAMGEGGKDEGQGRENAGIIFGSIGAAASSAAAGLLGGNKDGGGGGSPPSTPSLLSNPLVITGIVAGVLGGGYLLFGGK